MKGKGMAVTRFAQHGISRLAYEVRGEGQPSILLIHGLLQDRVTMRALMDALEDRSTVISMDMRGHGGSAVLHGLNLEMTDLAADAFVVLEAAGVNGPVVVVGVEIGGVIADTMQRLAPERVSDIIRINYPTAEMLDGAVLKIIADQAYRQLAEQAVTRWLTLSWGNDWSSTAPKARIAAARRSVEAIHPVLTALARLELEPRESLILPGGTPFAEDADIASVISRLDSMRPAE